MTVNVKLDGVQLAMVINAIGSHIKRLERQAETMGLFGAAECKIQAKRHADLRNYFLYQQSEMRAAESNQSAIKG